MFGGRTQNNGNGVNVNTRLYTSYSDTAMITMGGWNMNLSIVFHPFKGVNGDGIRQYAQENIDCPKTSLTVDNATALIKGIDEQIIPAVNAKETKSVAVAMGSQDNRKTLTISTVDGDVFITLAVGVDDDGKAPETSIIKHKFNTKTYFKDYNPSTGGGEEVKVQSDFLNFVKKLKGIYGFAPVQQHASKYDNAVKNAYSSRNANNNVSSNGGGYQAQTESIGASDMSEFLPLN